MLGVGGLGRGKTKVESRQADKSRSLNHKVTAVDSLSKQKEYRA